MILDRKISLVIPCRNEARGLKQLLTRVPASVDEVIVVDNNSSDNTREVAARMGALVVSEPRCDKAGIGYGYALQTGMKAASGDFVVTMDGDGTYPMHQIKEAVTYAAGNGLDFVVCERFPLIQNQAISWLRKFGIWILNTEVRILYGRKVNDILSGMWVVRRPFIKKLAVEEGGWNLSPEIKLAALLTPDIRCGVYHIDHNRREHEGSKQRIWQTGFDHLTYIWQRWLTRDSAVAYLYRLGSKQFTWASTEQPA